MKDNELTKGVVSWIGNRPENEPTPEEISNGAKEFISEQANPPGKDLNLTKDPGPARINGTLTGKSL